MIEPETRHAIETLTSSYSFGYDEFDNAVVINSEGEVQGRDNIVQAARTQREQLQAEGIQTRHY